MTNVLLKKRPVASWQFDSSNDKYVLDIGSVRVAEIDNSGNMKLKGRLSKL